MVPKVGKQQYLITYSQANLDVFPMRQSFGEALSQFSMPEQRKWKLHSGHGRGSRTQTEVNTIIVRYYWAVRKMD